MVKSSDHTARLNSSLLNTIIGIFLILIFSCLFAYQWKLTQLQIVSALLPKLYPTAYWFHSLLVVFLFFLALGICGIQILRFLFISELPLSKLFLMEAMTHFPLALSLFGFSIQNIFWAFVSVKVFLWLILLWKRQLRIRDSCKFHFIALFLIILVQSIFGSFASPTSWSNPIAGLRKGESGFTSVNTPLYLSNFTNAKAYDFSGFNHGAWGSLPDTTGSAHSPALSALSLLLNVASIDTEGYHKTLLIFFYLWSITGSFTFYLFVRYGLGLSGVTSILGGLLFLPANQYIANLFTNRMPLMAGVFLTLPIGLLLTRLSFRKANYGLALLAGTLFSLNYFILHSHPEAVIFGTGYWVGYLVYLLFFSSDIAGFLIKTKLFFISLVGFVLGNAISLSSQFESLLNKQSSVFGHSSQIGIRKAIDFTDAVSDLVLQLYPLLTGLGLFFPLIIWVVASHFRRRKSQRDLSWFIFISGILFFLLCPFKGTCMGEILSSHLGVVPLSFKHKERSLLYLFLSLFVLALFSLEHALFNHDKRKWNPDWMYLAIIVISFIAFYRRFHTFSDLVPQTLLVVAGYGLLLVRNKALKKGSFLRGGAILLCIAFPLASESAFQWRSPISQNEPLGCKPYIALKTLLMKYRLFGHDSLSGETLIKRRLTEFESVLKTDKRIEVNAVLLNYNETLTKRGHSSAVNLKGNELISFAEQNEALVDEFYFKHFQCQSNTNQSRVYSSFNFLNGVNFNYATLYEHIGSRFQRGLSATRHNYNFGIGEGLFLNDASIIPDLQYTTVYPPIQALYIVPGQYFDRTGYPNGPTQWEFDAKFVNHPIHRKILNISGIDILTFQQQDLKDLKNQDSFNQIPFEIQGKDTPPFAVFLNKNSYGMAYIAQTVRYVPKTVEIFFQLKPPFTKKTNETREQYKNEVDAHYQKLLQLENKHDILLEEAASDDLSSSIIGSPSNKLTIGNILGNKAVFQSHCSQKPCQLVFNYAALLGWKAFAGETPLPLQRANYAFLSAALPLGPQTIWMEYRPLSTILGPLITLLSLLLGLTASLRWKLDANKNINPE